VPVRRALTSIVLPVPTMMASIAVWMLIKVEYTPGGPYKSTPRGGSITDSFCKDRNGSKAIQQPHVSPASGYPFHQTSE